MQETLNLYLDPKAARAGGLFHLGGQVFCLNGRLLRRKDGGDITALCWAGFSCPRRQALLVNCAPARGLTCPLASSGPAAGAMCSQRKLPPAPASTPLVAGSTSARLFCDRSRSLGPR